MQLGRTAYTVTGAVLVGIGFLGMVLPGLPTTVFMIMALFCFKKGSARLENWLLNHPLFGETLRRWEKDHSISLRTKWIAVATMWAFGLASTIFVSPIWLKVLIPCVCGIGTWYIVSRKTTEVALEASIESAHDPLAA